MKKISLVLCLILILSCDSLTDEHYKAKKMVRDYLENTLHNPKSMEEVNWSVLPIYQYKCKDTVGSLLDCIQVTDLKTTIDVEKELGGERYVMKLTYRAENGYGALRKGYVYASYIKQDTVNFITIDEIYYSDKLGKIKDVKWQFDKPEFLYYKNYYFLYGEGKNSSLNNFYKKYPDLKPNY